MTLTLERFGIDQLDVRQRIELINLIWDSLPDDAPLDSPEWHREEIERRLLAADANPSAGEPWEKALEQIGRKA